MTGTRMRTVSKSDDSFRILTKEQVKQVHIFGMTEIAKKRIHLFVNMINISVSLLLRIILNVCQMKQFISICRKKMFIHLGSTIMPDSPKHCFRLIFCFCFFIIFFRYFVCLFLSFFFLSLRVSFFFVYFFLSVFFLTFFVCLAFYADFHTFLVLSRRSIHISGLPG